MNIKNLLIILFLSIVSKGISQENSYDIYNTLLSEYIAFEKQFVGGKIKDKSVYSLKEDLGIASYIRQDSSVPNLDLIVRYVFSKKDSLIKEIRYELDFANFEKKIEPKQNKNIRKALANYYLTVEKDLISKLGKSKIEGELTDKTVIDEENDYYKNNAWIIGNTRIDLLIKMSNFIRKEKPIYPNHKVTITYKTIEKIETEYIGRKKPYELIEKKSLPRKFTNKSRIPLISKCKNNHTEACLQNSISDLILSEANKINLTLKSDTLKIGVRINKNGSTSIMDNETKNSELKKVVTDVLSSMELIEPAYIKSLKRYETVSYSWYILIKNNEITNRFKN
ncbi:hypothetical protein [uncultured Maribacter sp.]|uniref:hypothetical protein n=1 Tax=uncultured Maribacter sp. TaxID=431308 RepID=UPI002602BE30|nr:hypothetical protein [uncultured Maribacter sp.]